MKTTLRTGFAAAILTSAIGGLTFFSSSDPHDIGVVRSPQWPLVRSQWLDLHGECAACGQKDNLNVHHIVPFHIDPTKELDPTNFITLCTDGPGHANCHLLFGHSGSFRSAGNAEVRRDATQFREMLQAVKF